jgi:hypothetical protein
VGVGSRFEGLPRLATVHIVPPSAAGFVCEKKILGHTFALGGGPWGKGGQTPSEAVRISLAVHERYALDWSDEPQESSRCRKAD